MAVSWRQSLSRGITRNVVALSIVSLLTDVSSEMLVYLVPLYLANVLATSPAIIGLIEGSAESVAGLMKLASGAISDRIHRRRSLVALGYGSSAVGKALFLIASTWPVVFLARIGDRLGKGIRTAPRDALIADSTDERYRGRAFGFHRAMDTLGAFLGVLAAFVLVTATQADAALLDAATFQTMVVVALVPAVLAVLAIFVGVRDVLPRTASGAEAAPQEPGAALAQLTRRERLRAAARSLPAAFWIFVAANTLFALGNSSDAFLALRTQQLGVSVQELLLIVVAFNAIDAAVSFPVGALSDRVGRRAPIAAAWLIYAVSYAGFALASSGTAIGALWLLYGAYYGINEAVGRAFIADVAPVHLRATGYGILNFAVALAILPASVIAGVLWDALNPSAPFWFGAACALIAVALLFAARPLRSAGARSAPIAAAATRSS